MIVSVNPKPAMPEFISLMKRTDDLLNHDALKRPKYYAGRGGNPLEDDVKSALDECAKGTPFENTIEKVSGQKFPDIVAAKFYGVEVMQYMQSLTNGIIALFGIGSLSSLLLCSPSSFGSFFLCSVIKWLS